MTIKINQNTTIDLIKKYISQKTGHPFIAIRLYPHPDYKKIIDSKSKSTNNIGNQYLIHGNGTFASNYLSIETQKYFQNPDDISLLTNYDNIFRFYIAELHEMSIMVHIVNL